MAVEWLEQGRCVVWTQLNRLRTPLEDLRVANPDLFDRLSRVSRVLEQAGSREVLRLLLGLETTQVENRSSLEDQAGHHIRLATKWDKLLEDVRRIPEFRDFLRPRQFSSIVKHLPSEGPVILINVHDSRCDALVLFADRNEPVHIPLKKISYKRAEELKDSLLTYLSANGSRMRHESRAIRFQVNQTVRRDIVRHVLDVLWTSVTKPIFDAIGFSASTPSQLIHITFTHGVHYF